MAEILAWYSEEVTPSQNSTLLHETYRFDRLANEFTVNQFIRQLLKKYETYAPKFDGRSAQGADCICEFRMGRLPVTGSMLPLVAAEIYEICPDLQEAFSNAHTTASPDGFWRWFCRHAGREYGI